MTSPRIPVGISSCLLGEQVRYDGGHKYDDAVHACLAAHVAFRPFCPEVAIGLGIPRPPIQLVRTGTGVAVRGVANPRHEVSAELTAYGRQVATGQGELCGYVFKARSPSCGLQRVRTVDTHDRSPRYDGTGAYAAAVVAARPNLPVAEEGELADAACCAHFLEQLRVYHRWRSLLHTGLTAAALIDFHTRHKLTLLAHDQAAYRRLGPLVAGVSDATLAIVGRRYETGLMQAMRIPASRRSHANVLQHLQGYVSRQLDADERTALTRTIERYRAGEVPLDEPLAILRECFERFPNPWVAQQTYLQDDA